MLDYEAEVASYTYKPGVSLSVLQTGSEIQTGLTQPIHAVGFVYSLRISSEALDSRTSGMMVPVKADFPIPDWIEDADTFAFFIRLCLIYWETHEVDEWIKRNNQRVFVPSHHGGNAISTMQTDIYARLKRPVPPA
jgi:hypothetical protein